MVETMVQREEQEIDEGQEYGSEEEKQVLESIHEEESDILTLN